ncbi:hypothetical protein A0J61_11923 [Choanephora cucurbitarum]|uniref:Uncharacterized protein n=1 Tax=Choanephora cucurbitarum TaxID=101091 RepID=A0A1C7LN25_9FUNG|nr:hypothetical protein A0J61_11923 [Choanephora cucurbitarum]
MGPFLNQEIAAKRLNKRIWTMNNHFATYHLYDLIKSYGPFKIPLLQIPGKNHTKYNDQLAKKDLYPARKDKPNSFRNHPLDYAETQAQLWEKFEDVDLDQLDMIANILAQSIYQAI